VRPGAPGAWPRPEGAGLRLERAKALKLAGVSDRVSQVAADECGVFLSDFSARLCGLDPADFSERWTIPAKWFGITGVVAETLIVENMSSSVLRGLDPATGKTRWEAKVPPGTQRHGPDLLVRGKGAEALLVDPRTGRKRQSIPLPWPEGVGRMLGGMMLRHFEEAGTLACFDLDARRVIWERKCPVVKGAQDDAEPRIRGGLAEAGVFVYGCSPALFGLDLRTGETRWELKASLSGVGILGDMALVEMPAPAKKKDAFGVLATVSCVELASGRIRWSRTSGEYGWPVEMRHVRAFGDDLVVGTHTQIVVVSARDGSVVLKHTKPESAVVCGTWREYLFTCAQRGRFEVLKASVTPAQGEAAGPKRRRGPARSADPQ
jgi:hypothetical protein